jgi:hypothetical protein
VIRLLTGVVFEEGDSTAERDERGEWFVSVASGRTHSGEPTGDVAGAESHGAGDASPVGAVEGGGSEG